ncbi:hypothetical protein CONPUDRAFT_169061 [Coniophora puteana RWD-64-598 SS2]|uniref:Uncharacterized protein n=1 Tax=Coniophora puteana (strain RWD-64-598) TaxID=741705 RepID=A0A5M3M930_CONPW|nr:uncharacterized protein CONPUDRAFT_169061 [Coniophora puteana RWD-64-598 SS2]EIW75782.1 hypothetical protein CONPUDRAFT_169061 [Coniophora puteana RWD-64-598 SS2]
MPAPGPLHLTPASNAVTAHPSSINNAITLSPRTVLSFLSRLCPMASSTNDFYITSPSAHRSLALSLVSPQQSRAPHTSARESHLLPLYRCSPSFDTFLTSAHVPPNLASTSDMPLRAVSAESASLRRSDMGDSYLEF